MKILILNLGCRQNLWCIFGREIQMFVFLEQICSKYFEHVESKYRIKSKVNWIKSTVNSTTKLFHNFINLIPSKIKFQKNSSSWLWAKRKSSIKSCVGDLIKYWTSLYLNLSRKKSLVIFHCKKKLSRWLSKRTIIYSSIYFKNKFFQIIVRDCLFIRKKWLKKIHYLIKSRGWNKMYFNGLWALHQSFGKLWTHLFRTFFTLIVFFKGILCDFFSNFSDLVLDKDFYVVEKFSRKILINEPLFHSCSHLSLYLIFKLILLLKLHLFCLFHCTQDRLQIFTCSIKDSLDFLSFWDPCLLR